MAVWNLTRSYTFFIPSENYRKNGKLPQDCLFRAYLLHVQLHCLCSFNLRFGKNKSYRIITMHCTSFAFQIWLILACMKKKNWNSAVLLHVHKLDVAWYVGLQRPIFDMIEILLADSQLHQTFVTLKVESKVLHFYQILKADANHVWICITRQV